MTNTLGAVGACAARPRWVPRSRPLPCSALRGVGFRQLLPRAGRLIWLHGQVAVLPRLPHERIPCSQRTGCLNRLLFALLPGLFRGPLRPGGASGGASAGVVLPPALQSHVQVRRNGTVVVTGGAINELLR